MTNHSQTDPMALQGPQNRAQRTVAVEANNPETGMTAAAELESVGRMRADDDGPKHEQPHADQRIRPNPCGGAILMGGTREAETIVGIVRFDVTILGFNGAEIEAGMLTAPLRAGAKDGKLQVEPLDLRAAFAEALDTATKDPAITALAQSNIDRTEN